MSIEIIAYWCEHCNLVVPSHEHVPGVCTICGKMDEQKPLSLDDLIGCHNALVSVLRDICSEQGHGEDLLFFVDMSDENGDDDDDDDLESLYDNTPDLHPY